MPLYAVAKSRRVRGSACRRIPYLARQCGEQSGIGFQPVSSVDYGWLAVLSGPTISDCLKKQTISSDSISAASLVNYVKWRKRFRRVRRGGFPLSTSAPVTRSLLTKSSTGLQLAEVLIQEQRNATSL
jgi:hypothetical protein